MTALLELKQKIKNLYGQYEIYILPVLRCILAFLYFTWINVNMGYMSQLNNIFRIQHTGSSSYWKWFVKQCSFCASGRLWSNCLLFYSFSEGAA